MLKQEEYDKIKKLSAELCEAMKPLQDDLRYSMEESRHFAETAAVRNEYERRRILHNANGLEAVYGLIQAFRKNCSAIPEEVDMAIRFQNAK